MRHGGEATFDSGALSTAFARETVLAEAAKRGCPHAARAGNLAPGTLLFDYTPPERLPEDQANSEKSFAAMRLTLERLADKIASEGLSTDPALDNTELPAGYTYLGQLIAHDMMRSRRFEATEMRPVSSYVGDTTPGLDLDCIYGEGPDRNALYYASSPVTAAGRRYMLRLGRVSPVGFKFNGKPVFSGEAEDIPRAPVCNFIAGEHDRAATFEPLIADTRNEDNLVLSQMVVLFHKFHNKVAAAGAAEWGEETFNRARAIVELTWRAIIRDDFMPRLLDPNVCAFYEALIDNGVSGDAPKALVDFGRRLKAREIGLPLESTFAGFRFGHSMVRPHYSLNDVFVPSGTAPVVPDLDAIMAFQGLTGGRHLPMTADWVIDWRRFFQLNAQDDISDDGVVNPARKIRPMMPSRLAGDATKSDADRLALRTLLKGYAFRLPTGQAVAKRLGISQVVPAHAIRAALSRPVNEFQPYQELDAAQIDLLSERTPLFYYVLVEAEHFAGGRRLGPAGSHLAAIPMVQGLMAADAARDAAASADARTVGLTVPRTMRDLVLLVDPKAAGQPS
ncbi:MAG TPA: peroxidase family protein [Rhizobiaceae bacterium]|nr:peroxidase family protein [Rhizobiaceae bacterium]